jgi:transposase
MYKDLKQWQQIRHRVLVEQESRRSVQQQTGLHWKTISKILGHSIPPGLKKRKPHICPPRKANTNSRQNPDARKRGLHVRPDHSELIAQTRLFIRNLEDCVVALPKARLPKKELRRLIEKLREVGFAAAVNPTLLLKEYEDHRWLNRLQQGVVSPNGICELCGDPETLELLLHQAAHGTLRERRKAIIVLGRLRGVSKTSLGHYLVRSPAVVWRHYRRFRRFGLTEYLRSYRCRKRKATNQELRSAVFALLHSPPADWGLNRTSWKKDDLVQQLGKQGFPVSKDVLREIIKSAGFRWIKARVVLTSHDPEYRQKLDRIKSILSQLKDDERFFSIDEFGPFAVKMQGGKKLVGPGEKPTVPQFQKSKGRLIVTAALELSRNQVTHFYSKAKNTIEMIKLAEVLLEKYKDCARIYLSWDAASWHVSDLLADTVRLHNEMVTARQSHLPLVVLAPLPASAQFLNVIESVFSGMAKAIIHNSNYQSVDHAKAAIDRYFQERNNYFREHPKKAGKTIWGQERIPCAFAEDQNCKDPNW